ncbi:Type I phosphodiesterase / nucleotide pyrophosphatase [Paenibacillus sp. 1_12]|uniref:alkaline phosphatase family protein n=1 Tax=Paenibacillus sp. 1_12 TaxID=1566278 RepID=UPI0008F2AAE7|nr:alkaline phosphatase family protein [Paenibacillus sp. 1_12]SFK96088.1 Type I phosphodiesterase / nucleotide pyrophosphatase [Paenibacillus sp. 1_12]
MEPINRVIIIGWDGAGTFVQRAHTPHLDRFIQSGAFTFDAQTVLPSISAQCWGALLHGVVPEKHGLTNDLAAEAAFPEDSAYPSVFRLAREAYPHKKLASFSAWQPINDGIIERSLSVYKVNNPVDGELAQAAANYIRDNPDLLLMYIDLDWPDAMGHRYGFNTPEQIRGIEETDAHTGIILDAIQAAGIGEDSLLIIVTDHGGGGIHPQEHGSDHPLDKTIFWGCIGPGIQTGAALEGFTIMDTAAVVAHALGLQAPKAWDAKLPSGLFANETNKASTSALD